MPATLILLPAVTIGLIAWLVAWLFTREARPSPRDEIRRLQNHAAWLEQRLDTARQERWDREMIISLSDQLGAACEQLERARRGTRRTAPVSAR